MQDQIELAKVKAFYYQKAAELGNYKEANGYIQGNDGYGWSSDFICDGELAWDCEEYRIKPEGRILYGAGWVLDPYKKTVIIEAFGHRFEDGEYMNARHLFHETREAAIEHGKAIYQIED